MNSKQPVFNAIGHGGPSSRVANSSFGYDRSAMLEAVGKNGLALAHAAERYKIDAEIVMLAVKNRGSALKFATDEHKSDKTIVLAALRKDPTAIRFVQSEKLKNDPEIAKIVNPILHSDLRINSCDFKSSFSWKKRGEIDHRT